MKTAEKLPETPPQTQPEKKAASRRMKGKFSSRLSDRPKGGRHKSFRSVPEFFRLAVESLSEYALLTMGKDLVISSWSGPAAALFGYKESEIIGKPVQILFTPEDIAKGIDKQEFVDALKKGRQDDERWHVCKDGTRLWCYGLSFPLKDEKGDVRGFVKLIRDDTARKKKEDLLRESEQRLRLASESTGLGTWDYDIAKKSLTLSKRAAELFGLGDDAKSAGYEEFISKVDPEDRARIAEQFEHCIALDAECKEELEFRIQTRDGGVRWVHTRARAFVDGPHRSSKPDRLIGTVVDITERRQRQLEAQERQRELETTVKERTSGLRALNKELETFAYSASHDLRAPLRKIAAFSHAILQSAKGKLSADEQGYLDTVRGAAAKMQKLIDDQLSLARVTQQPLSLVDCDFSAIAREVADELQKSAPERRVQFVIASDIRAHVDCKLLTIALRNLLDNAWKFTSKHTTARVEFGTTTIEGRTTYFVRDDGAGFDMKYADKLFGAFQRLHREEEFPGTGVGLGLVERIIRRHRGRIWVEAGVEKGATFFFTLNTEDA